MSDPRASDLLAVVTNVTDARASAPTTLTPCRSGLQQRRNSFEDGVAGTTCPIPPGSNFTYIMQAKDQIGTYYYFPSLAFHKAAGGFGGIRVLSRPQIPVPFPPPAADYTVLIGDWYKANHTVRRRSSSPASSSETLLRSACILTAYVTTNLFLDGRTDRTCGTCSTAAWRSGSLTGCSSTAGA